jgi:hypothetical protein
MSRHHSTAVTSVRFPYRQSSAERNLCGHSRRSDHAAPLQSACCCCVRPGAAPFLRPGQLPIRRRAQWRARAIATPAHSGVPCSKRPEHGGRCFVAGAMFRVSSQRMPMDLVTPATECALTIEPENLPSRSDPRVIERHFWCSRYCATDRALQDNPTLQGPHTVRLHRRFSCSSEPPDTALYVPNFAYMHAQFDTSDIASYSVLNAAAVSSDNRERGTSSALFPAKPPQSDAASADMPSYDGSAEASRSPGHAGASPTTPNSPGDSLFVPRSSERRP